MLSSQGKRKRKLLTLKTKVYIIKKFDSGEKISQISKNLNLPNSTVSSIIKDKKRILAACTNEAVLNSSTIIRKRHGIIAQMECTLKIWCEKQAEENVRLSQNDVCTQAKAIFEELKRDYGEAAKDETFLASKGWYFRFKRRCEGNRVSEQQEEENLEDGYENEETKVKKEQNTEKAPQYCDLEPNYESSFSYTLKTIIKKGGYTPQTVINVDEIGLYWKRMPERSNLAQQEQTSNAFLDSKDRLTILLGGNAIGDFKLKPLVIHRIENPRALQNKSKGGLTVIWKSNPRASMTASLFDDWFGNYFIPEVERYCYANNIPCKVLLILDSAVYHPSTTLVNFDHRVKVIFVPPGQSTSSQPMNQEVLNIFRALYTRSQFRQLIETAKQNDFITIEELWKEFNILDAIRIIVDSWAAITESDWKRAWHKLCPFFDNTDNDADENTTVAEIIEEIVNLALNLEMKVDRKDVSELIGSHNKEPTIEELLEMQEYSTNEELEMQDPLLGEAVMTVESLTEAFNHIKMGLQILENIDINQQRARATKIGVTKLLSAYEDILNEKIKLTASQEESMDTATTSNN